MNRGRDYGGHQSWSESSNVSQPEVQMLMDQVRHLQKKVLDLSHQSHQSQSDLLSSEPYSNNEHRILLVSNLPPTLATCDAVYFMFDRFGMVERVKILHNKRNAALVQMQTPEMAHIAVNDQYVLKRTGADIYVNFSNKVSLVRLPTEMGLPDDGLSKDFTGPIQPTQNRYDYEYMENQYYEASPSNGLCFLASSLPDSLAEPNALCNLFGYYGDVHRVKILHNKKDCALVQMAKPHQAATVKKYMDQLRLQGNKICISFSRMQSIKMPSDIGINDDSGTKDFTNVKGRFRNPAMAAKLSKNLCAPTNLLHVANLPDQFTIEDLKKYLTEEGYTVTHIQDCGKDGQMALVQFATLNEAVMALAKLHNVTPGAPGVYKTKNDSGLCFSFSCRKLSERMNE